MKTVNELNENELEELRESYFQELLDTSPDFIGDFENSSQIAMEDVKNHYEGISFVEEDFFCNLNEDDDLFENPELIPDNVMGILGKYPNEMTYDLCSELEKELKSIGYDIDWGLDAIPFNLRKIK